MLKLKTALAICCSLSSSPFPKASWHGEPCLLPHVLTSLLGASRSRQSICWPFLCNAQCCDLVTHALLMTPDYRTIRDLSPRVLSSGISSSGSLNSCYLFNICLLSIFSMLNMVIDDTMVKKDRCRLCPMNQNLEGKDQPWIRSLAI